MRACGRAGVRACGHAGMREKTDKFKRGEEVGSAPSVVPQAPSLARIQPALALSASAESSIPRLCYNSEKHR